MPNHVTNILTVTGDPKRCAELFEAIKTEEFGVGSIDFGKIIPVPDNIYQGNLGKEEFEKYGKNNWLDWNLANWGTKWNSYGYDKFTSQEFDGENITFQTAWSKADQVIGKLAEQYPDLDFTYRWADEEFGVNVGIKEYGGGEKTEEFIPISGSKEALELAAEVHQISLEDEGYIWNENISEYEFCPETTGLEMG